MISARHSGVRRLNASFLRDIAAVSADALSRRRVLITGAGGSIGSALAHAMAGHGPERILLLESSEQALYRIDRDLGAPHAAILADAGDACALEEVFEQHRPHVVFHAAAFKHVPLMESHPFAAVRNNAVGTYVLARAAVNHDAEQVILVSTDKAADPASIMGASKRVAELTALALSSHATKIKAVRMGNVYGSQGSVVPLFQEQMAQDKPVTVTHAEATRYFLSMGEAVALLLFALSGEFSSGILVPDLTDPIRVEDMARDLIRQSGSQAEVVYTGLRPGEKLHEQLLSSEESFLEEAPSPLRAIRSSSIAAPQAEQAITGLRDAVQARDLLRMMDIVKKLVPGYSPSEALLAQQTSTEYRA